MSAGMSAPASELDTVLPSRSESTWRTVRRGMALSPELLTGLAGTVALAVVAMAGRVAVPVAIQQGIDRGVRAPGGPDVNMVATIAVVTAAVLVVTTICANLMMRRLFTVSETALADVRARAFRHVHDLSMLHRQAQRRGALVSRVTGDVEAVTGFLQWGGVVFMVSGVQTLITTAVMAVYSWQLTLVILIVYAPAVLVIRSRQRHLGEAFGLVRERFGTMLGAVSESVVGASVIRAYGVSRRTAARLDDTIEGHRDAQQRALRAGSTAFALGDLAAGLALAAVVVVGVWLGVGGRLSIGELTAFLFLVTLFVQPVQTATEVLNQTQNAVAGWRRVLDLLELRPDVVDPGEAGSPLPEGPLDVRFVGVCFSYPDGPQVLTDVELSIAAKSRVAVVGETGGGKTTFAKLLTRLMDPTHGQVLLSGMPLDRVRFSSLRSRVVMVPQDGFLFNATVAENVRFGRPSLTDTEIELAFTELGLRDWVNGLPQGMHTAVQERGEALSVGERQLVALVRAYVADPDLLVLDEATSAVDPATEVRLQRALDMVTRGRTTVTIAHRLSTAQAADEVVVVDHGRIVQRGRHDELAADTESVYGRLYASWLEQTR